MDKLVGTHLIAIVSTIVLFLIVFASLPYSRS